MKEELEELRKAWKLRYYQALDDEAAAEIALKRIQDEKFEARVRFAQISELLEELSDKEKD